MPVSGAGAADPESDLHLQDLISGPVSFSWEISARIGILNDFIFSSPSRVLSCFLSMAADRTIFYHTGVTVLETLLSFFLVTWIGIFGAVALWSSRRLAKILEPYLVILNSLPKSALAPLLIVWLGNNMKTIITAAVSVAVFGSILTLYNGFLSMDPDQIRLIYTLGGKQKDVLTKVLLPGSVPLIISNMKVNIGLCLVGVIIGEFLSAAGRPWLPHHLRQPGLQAGSRDHVHRDPLYSVRNPVSGGGSAGTEV
ncbi:MAG: ABC transporter permease [Pilosibacter sp.]